MRWWVAVFVLAALERSARADDLAVAAAHIEALEYTEAVNTLESMIRRGDSTAGALAQAYALLGRAAASSGQDAQAIWAYQRLLALDPAFAFGEDVSPRLERNLEAARSQLPAGPSIAVDLVTPRETWADRPTSVTLSIRTDALGLVRGMRVYYRPAGTTTFSRVTVRGPPPLEAIVPALSASPGGQLEIWVTALDEYGNELAAVGSATHPRSLAVRAPSATPRTPMVHPRSGRGDPGADEPEGGITTRWWFWTGLVALAAGATVGAIVLTTPEPDCPGAHACFQVHVEGPP